MNHNGKSHLWLMVLGCLIPIAALGAIFFFNVTVSVALLAGLFLLCPLIHVWMMLGMKEHNHKNASSSNMPATLTKERINYE